MSNHSLQFWRLWVKIWSQRDTSISETAKDIDSCCVDSVKDIDSHVSETAKDICKANNYQPNCHKSLCSKTASRALVAKLCGANALGALLWVPETHWEPLSPSIRPFTLSIDWAILVYHLCAHPLLTLWYRRINVCGMLMGQRRTRCCCRRERHTINTWVSLLIASEAPELSFNVVISKQAVVFIGTILAIVPAVATFCPRDTCLGLPVPFCDGEDGVHLFILTEKLALVAVKPLCTLVEHSKS